MSVIAVVYVPFILLLAALSARGAETSPVGFFRLYTDFQTEPAEPVRAAIQEEVNAIMAPIGWNFTWTSLKTGGNELSIRLAVVRFIGRCSPDSEADVRLSHFILGETETQRGATLPYTYIYCDAIRSMLTPALPLDRTRREVAFGRAVGRVLGHELYHIFGNTRQHGSSGLGEATYSARELLAAQFRFGIQEVQLLRNTLLSALLDFNKWRIGSKPLKGYSVYVKGGCVGCHGFLGEGTQWGTSLQRSESLRSAANLSALLKSRTSGMYRRAHELHVAWPSLGAGDTEELARFLQSLFEETAGRENSERRNSGSQQ